ncbi:MAG: DUF1634 domain-containing protein [Thermoguttaceae bacterium]
MHTDHAKPLKDSEPPGAEMSTLIGYVLLGGVLLSMSLIIAGLFWHWVNTGRLGVDYQVPKMNLFQFVVAEMRDLIAGRFRPRLLVSLGITALLLTPYLRVLVSLLFFAGVEHNWKYSLFTGFVLAVLTYSLFLR